MPAHETTSRPAAASAPAATAYVCPMHPEIRSTDPNARCPKCNMKINKPAAAATAPATQPAAPAAGHAHDHGGMNK